MLQIAFRPSRQLAAVLTAIHIAAGATILPLHVPLQFKLALATAIAASLIHALWRYALLRSSAALVALELSDASEADVQTCDGAWHHARILGTSYVSPLLTVLNLKFDGCLVARHLVIAPDMVATEDFRTLRVILRWKCASAPKGANPEGLPRLAGAVLQARQ